VIRKTESCGRSRLHTEVHLITGWRLTYPSKKY
jgi:hypothetical protein